MDFNDYAYDPHIYDEMFQSGGLPWERSQGLYDTLRQMPAADLASIQEEVSRSFLQEGISFMVYGDDKAEERIIPVDCIPRIVTGAEWRMLEAGLSQRLRALNRFLNDVYNEARIIKDGVIPEDMVRGCPQYRPEMEGYTAPHGAWVAVCGTDLVRTNDGYFVLEDNLRVPSGVSYMIATRRASKAGFRRLYRSSRVREVERYGQLLLTVLRELAPEGVREPTIALLTPGIYNAAFYEHVFLAHELGAELVEGRDLLTRDGFVYMRTTEGLRRVDIIYRRVDDVFLDPLVFRADSVLGVPGLLDVCKRGNVTLVNTPGSGVADDKSIYAFVPDIVRYYLGEEPLLSNVETYLCRRPQDLEYTLDNLDRLVVKRVGESGGYGMLMGPHATPSEREEYAKQILAVPSDFISQPVLSFSRSPCLVPATPPHPQSAGVSPAGAPHPGWALEPRHVDLRPFVLQGREPRITPGAFCRVALRRGGLVVNSSQGGGCKDIWVLED